MLHQFIYELGYTKIPDDVKKLCATKTDDNTGIQVLLRVRDVALGPSIIIGSEHNSDSA